VESVEIEEEDLRLATDDERPTTANDLNSPADDRRLKTNPVA
jgi:hypothetical protein